jgi:4-alpha-glucanotransferase
MEEIEKYLSTTKSYTHWQNIGITPRHGITTPLFSIRTKKSCGIGEFTDLFMLIDWCIQVGFDVIQLLPLNEMGHDFSPYNALSSCALDPIYLGLRFLPHLDIHPDLLSSLDQFDNLNKLDRVDYITLRHKKNQWLHKYFDKTFDAISSTHHYLTFIKQNTWLDNYGLFRILKEDTNYEMWYNWNNDIKNITPKKALKLLEQHKNRINFYLFLQYLCYLQMEQVKTYATTTKVLIKGDIPILINRDSVDVWENKAIFDLSHSAGCPPDDFSVGGQNWGFPIYNWEALKKNDYAWWRRRLNVATALYHLYRIDHVVGLFRIWAILPNETPIEGRYLPKNPSMWGIQGHDHLEMLLHASQMLPIAEDLGLIPKVTYTTIKKLGICGTKVMRWQKHFGRYLKLSKYEKLSVTTLSTHDITLLGQWWEDNKKEAKKLSKFYQCKHTKTLTSSVRKKILIGAHSTSSLFHINLLQEYLALYPDLVYTNPEDERINIPGTISATNWSYRTKPYLEDIIHNNHLTKDIKEILSLANKNIVTPP